MPLVFTDTKLGTRFNIKDKTSKKHQHNLTHSVFYPNVNCNEEHNGETVRRLIQWGSRTVVTTLTPMFSNIQLRLISQQ